jgi:hypothetical protein
MVGPRRSGAWIFRESRLVRVSDLDPSDFPERRDLASRYAARYAAHGRLLDRGDLETIAGFIRQQISA